MQEDYRQVEVDTVQKLDRYIRTCAAVIHLVGEQPGAVADAQAVQAYLKAEPGFLSFPPTLTTCFCTSLKLCVRTILHAPAAPGRSHESGFAQ